MRRVAAVILLLLCVSAVLASAGGSDSWQKYRYPRSFDDARAIHAENQANVDALRDKLENELFAKHGLKATDTDGILALAASRAESLSVSATPKPKPECTWAARAYFSGSDDGSRQIKAASASRPLNDPGNHQLCDVNDKSGRFCSVVWRIGDRPFPPKNMTGQKLFWNFCVPRNCSQADFQDNSILFYMLPLNFMVFFLAAIPESARFYCLDSPEPIPSTDTGAIVMVFVCCFFAALTLAGTLWDVLPSLFGFEWHHKSRRHSASREHSLRLKATSAVHSDFNGTVATVPAKAQIQGETAMQSVVGGVQHSESTSDADEKKSADDGSIRLSVKDRDSDASKELRQPLMGEANGDVTGKSKAQYCDPKALCTCAFWKRAGVVVLESFSVTRNLPRLIAPVPVGKIDLEPLNGIRVLSMCWVIAGHTLSMDTNLATDSTPAYAVMKLIERPSFAIMTQAPFSVDTFFFLSGLLAAHLVLQELNKKGTLSWPLYYIHRYLRLTPVYMFWLFFWTYLIQYMGNGPLWAFAHLFLGPVEPCVKYWWTNLLYINNFHPENFDDACFGWAWYLANDMQFSILLPILVFIYYKNKTVGWNIVLLLLMGQFMVVGILVEKQNFYVGIFDKGSKANMNNQLYDKPYCRIGAYLAGVGCAYILDYYLNHQEPKHNSGKHKRKLSSGDHKQDAHEHERRGSDGEEGEEGHTQRPCVFLGVDRPTWLALIAAVLAAFFLLACLFGPYDINKHGPASTYNWSEAATIIYLSFSRFFWAVGLALIVGLFAFGYGGPIKPILAHRFWIPLARLSYQAYLVHEIWVLIFEYSRTQLWMWSELGYTYDVIGNVFISYLIALLGWLCIEKPLMNLETLAFDRKR